MVAREELHRLVDLLPEEDWTEAQQLLFSFIIDDEPVTPEDLAAAAAEGEAQIARGEFVTLDELKRNFGL